MSGSGPATILPDQETAEQALMRSVDFHSADVEAFWLPRERRIQSADKAAECGHAILEINT